MIKGFNYMKVRRRNMREEDTNPDNSPVCIDLQNVFRLD